MPPKLIGLFLIIYAALTIRLIIDLWKKHPKDSVAKKILWTGILFFPVFGWLLYGGIYELPSKNRPTGKTPGSG